MSILAYFPQLHGSVEKEETFSQNFASIGFYLLGQDRSNIKLLGAELWKRDRFCRTFCSTNRTQILVPPRNNQWGLRFLWIRMARCKQCAVDQFPVNLACVAWWFWLGAQSNKGGLRKRNREETGAGATVIIFLAASPLIRARFAHVFVVSVVLPTKPPCYAGYCVYCKLGNTNLSRG